VYSVTLCVWLCLCCCLCQFQFNWCSLCCGEPLLQAAPLMEVMIFLVFMIWVVEWESNCGMCDICVELLSEDGVECSVLDKLAVVDI